MTSERWQEIEKLYDATLELEAIALLHAALGKTDEAFRWLEKAYDECVEWMIFTNVDPRLDPLRTDTRFSHLLGRLGFAPRTQDRLAMKALTLLPQLPTRLSRT